MDDVLELFASFYQRPADWKHLLVLTTYDTDEDILRAVEAGAVGYLLKDAPEKSCSGGCEPPPGENRCWRIDIDGGVMARQARWFTTEPGTGYRLTASQRRPAGGGPEGPSIQARTLGRCSTFD